MVAVACGSRPHPGPGRVASRPGLRAARGEGIRGERIAGQCVSDKNSCTWYGEFVLPDGKVQLPRVTYTGSLGSVHPGWTTPALNTGAGDEVYPLHGSDRWVHDLIGVAGCLIVISFLIWRSVLVRPRRRRPGAFRQALIVDREILAGDRRRSKVVCMSGLADPGLA